VAQHGTQASTSGQPVRACGHQRLKVRLVPVVLAQAVVAAVQVAPLQRRLAFELLDEMAMPVQAAHKRLQSGTLSAGAGVAGGQRGDLVARGLHHLAHAQAAILIAAVNQKFMQNLQPRLAPAQLPGRHFRFRQTQRIG
jgi:hypothetical protein